MIYRILINGASTMIIFILMMCMVMSLLILLEPSLFATWTF